MSSFPTARAELGAERRRRHDVGTGKVHVKALASPGLFWRTFLLILLLLAASSLAWLQSFRVFEREPRAQQLAEQVISIVNITRSALLYSDPALRLTLLADLADNQGIRIVPLEAADKVRSFADLPFLRRARERVQQELGPGTRIAAEVNGISGLWVSFSIDTDDYWVYIERDPLARSIGTQWIGWALIAAIASLLGAVAITRVVNRPLARLSQAAGELGAGRTPDRLPENGPAEIATVNASFNRMVSDLAQSERDRALLLAGVSHDLRTPLTRLRLEVEINDLPADVRANMVADLEQTDRILAQFLDYARAEPAAPKTEVELAALLEQALEASRLNRDATVDIDRRIERGIRIAGLPVELSRALANLLTNADRYGRDPQTGRLALQVQLHATAQTASIEIADHGPGVASDRLEQLLRPFVRGDTARSGAAGAGLGLAIVERIARLHGGSFRLLPNSPAGLRAQLQLPRPESA
jgi:two-component system osmolarity sensor histidine kinase EnvZ